MRHCTVDLFLRMMGVPMLLGTSDRYCRSALAHGMAAATATGTLAAMQLRYGWLVGCAGKEAGLDAAAALLEHSICTVDCNRGETSPAPRHFEH
eukprot:COSAG01_NODE_3440_length_6092_cov_8.006503_4_plen_94_part_00